MSERMHKLMRSRRRPGVLKKTLMIVRALVILVRDMVHKDAVLVWRHGRLFVGILFTVVGILSFSSGVYCDGNKADYFGCTRPSTYYDYSWWAICLVVIGTFLIVLWFLRRK